MAHITDVVEIAAQAWDATKDANDPKFNDCALDHRNKLITVAFAVIDHGNADVQGLEKFEATVRQLSVVPEESVKAAPKQLAAPKKPASK